MTKISDFSIVFIYRVTFNIPSSVPYTCVCVTFTNYAELCRRQLTVDELNCVLNCALPHRMIE